MKQIIEDVLQAEAAATSRLKATREQAMAITAKAEVASLEQINQAKGQCQQKMQAIIEEATRSADQVKARMLEQSEGQIRDILSKDSAEVDMLIQTICEMILGASTGKGIE